MTLAIILSSSPRPSAIMVAYSHSISALSANFEGDQLKEGSFTREGNRMIGDASTCFVHDDRDTKAMRSAENVPM